MSTDEIKVSKNELDDCKGKLKSTLSSWRGVTVVSSSPIAKSSGKSESTVVDCTDLTREIKTALWTLLNNSIGYFDSVGASFQDADNKAAQKIDSLTK